MYKKRDVLESDKRLLQFHTYDEYLDYLVSKADVCYFRNYITARKIAELGYRNSGDMLTKEEFYRKLADVTEAVFPSRKPYELSSLGIDFTDIMYSELANRERGNRIGLVATIIFIRYQTKDGHEVSGYIDYADRLLTENWGPFFRGKKKLRLRATDLAFFNWRNEKAHHNDSLHYKVIFDTQKGLMFKHRNDRKVVLVDPSLPSPGQNTFRERIFTKHFDHFILYDHYLDEDIQDISPFTVTVCDCPLKTPLASIKDETFELPLTNRMWELLVLTNLKWDISSVTAQDFISHILRKIPVDQSSCNCQMLVKHTQTFIALCATDFKFSIYTPSIIASASIAASLQGLDWTNKNNCPLPELLSRIHRITGIEREYLQSCIDQIEETVREAMAHRGPGNDLTVNSDSSNSLNSSNSNSHFFSDKIADHGKAETPTDVRDVHF